MVGASDRGERLVLKTGRGSGRGEEGGVVGVRRREWSGQGGGGGRWGSGLGLCVFGISV